MNGIGWGGMWFSWIFWLLLLVIIISGVVTLIIKYRSHDEGRNLPPAEDALDILKKRYARGEITREQFDLMKQDIIKN